MGLLYSEILLSSKRQEAGNQRLFDTIQEYFGEKVYLKGTVMLRGEKALKKASPK